jgi:hypothetical protein
MTLVECIGAVTVLVILAAALVPVAIRLLDRIAADRETASLRALGDALQASILRNSYIPSYADWASTIAAQAGLDVGSVTNNLRNRPRIVLADASGWLSTNLPYTQTYAGTPSLPVNARAILLSSLGAALPMTTSIPAAADFDNLWNAPPNTVPTTGPWAGWNGRPEDVIIQRVNLTPLFVNLVLSTYTANSNGQYAINGSGLYQAPKNNGVSGYYLQGTLLQLYTGAPSNTFNATQILTKDSSFVYEGGTWKSSIQGTATFGVGDVAGIVAAFLAATPNTHAQNPIGNTQQVMVVQSFIDYMSNYNVWAGGSFTDNNLRNYLKNTLQPNMMTVLQGLYSGSYYPTNPLPFP